METAKATQKLISRSFAGPIFNPFGAIFFIKKGFSHQGGIAGKMRSGHKLKS